jgi:NAD(P) transhydrogenase subunit beta
MVALLHSFVGLAATLVGYSKFIYDVTGPEGEMHTQHKVETFIGVFIGAITFIGSVVACGKLEGKIRSNPLIICGAGRHVINGLVMTTCFGLLYGFIVTPGTEAVVHLVIMTVLALFIGWHLIMAIGGADMPVVVSMLNSYSGWTTSASGFLLENDLLIISGALIGSSGAILSYIMCKAMNRGFISVIAGGFGQGTATAAANVMTPTGT